MGPSSPKSRGARAARTLATTISLATTVAVAIALPLAAAELPPANTGTIYIGEFNDDAVSVHAADGTFLRSFTAPGLDGPRGIAIAPDGAIYVASQFTSWIYVFDQEEQLTNIITHSSLSGPTGMMVSGGELFVCSFLTDRIVVFGLDGGFRRWFTGGGLNGPTGIASDREGNIYVTNVFPSAVHKFDRGGGFVERFRPSGLLSPAGIARDRNDTFYVASSAANFLIKLDVNGTSHGLVFHPELDGPQGVAIDDRGHLLVSSYFRAKLLEFDAAEAFVGTIGVSSHSTPRSIAYRSNRVGDIDDDGTIGFGDLLQILTVWGPCPEPPVACLEDIDGDGTAGFGDVLQILADWDLEDGNPGGGGIE